MTWNYRVMRQRFDGIEQLGIHEVFYDDDGNIMTWTEDPVIVVDSLDEFEKIFGQMREGIAKDILDEDEELGRLGGQNEDS